MRPKRGTPTMRRTFQGPPAGTPGVPPNVYAGNGELDGLGVGEGSDPRGWIVIWMLLDCSWLPYGLPQDPLRPMKYTV